MKSKREMFESAMRKNGLFDEGSKAMVVCDETGEFLDPDTNAMWAGFIAAFDEISEALPKKERPNWGGLDAYEFGFYEGVNETINKIADLLSDR